MINERCLAARGIICEPTHTIRPKLVCAVDLKAHFDIRFCWFATKHRNPGRSLGAANKRGVDICRAPTTHVNGLRADKLYMYLRCRRCHVYNFFARSKHLLVNRSRDKGWLFIYIHTFKYWLICFICFGVWFYGLDGSWTFKSDPNCCGFHSQTEQ